MVVRQLTTKNPIIRLSRRNLCYSPTILQSESITSNSWSEFHNQPGVLARTKQSPFQNHSNLPIQSTWRHYSSRKRGKDGRDRSSAASGGSNDDSGDKPVEPRFNEADYESDYESDDDDLHSSLVLSKVPDDYPNVPILATAYPLFPKFIKVFDVKDEALGKLLWNQYEKGFPYAGVFARKSGNALDHTTEVKDLNEVHPIGSFVKITEMTLEGGKYRFVATAHRRIRINQEVFLQQDELKSTDAADFDVARLMTAKKPAEWNAIMANTQNVKEELPDIHSDKYKAVSMEMVKTIRDIIMSSSLIRDNLYLLLGNNLRVNDDPTYLADLSTSITSAKPQEMQEVMTTTSVDRRMELALELLMKEKQIIELQKKIGKEVEDKVKQTQREFMLREQLKAIKKELGLQKDDNVALAEKYRKALEGKTVPENVSKIIDEEIQKLGYLDNNATESAYVAFFLNHFHVSLLFYEKRFFN